MRAMMRVIGFSLLVPALTVSASEVRVGDSAQTVVSVLGWPQGYIRSGSFLLLTYERGKVELRDGKVVSVSLISPEAASAMRAEREKQRRRLMAEGLALRRRVAESWTFDFKPASERLAFWRGFRSRYPEIPVDKEYAAALKDAEAESAKEQARADHALRIAEMERRVAEAEQRVRDVAALSRGVYVSATPVACPVIVVYADRPCRSPYIQAAAFCGTTRPAQVAHFPIGQSWW